MVRLLRLCVHRNMNVITPRHPTPPHRSLIMKQQCLCLQDSRKDDEVAPVCAQEHERYYHPTPPHRSPSATRKIHLFGALSDPMVL